MIDVKQLVDSLNKTKTYITIKFVSISLTLHSLTTARTREELQQHLKRIVECLHDIANEIDNTLHELEDVLRRL